VAFRLTIDDAHRALILIGSLQAHASLHGQKNIHELLVVIPDAQAFAFSIFESTSDYPQISLIHESSLVDAVIQHDWQKYALQMLLKLLVAKRVKTAYYITLDADIVIVGMLNKSKLLPDGKGLFSAEPRSVHPHWWQGSSRVLGLLESDYPNATFGVTPAILSTMGSMMFIAGGLWSSHT